MCKCGALYGQTFGQNNYQLVINRYQLFPWNMYCQMLAQYFQCRGVLRLPDILLRLFLGWVVLRMGCVSLADWFVLALYLHISWESGIFAVSFRKGYEF